MSLARKRRREAQRKLTKMDAAGRDAIIKMADDNEFLRRTNYKIGMDLAAFFADRQAAIEDNAMNFATTNILWCLHLYFGFGHSRLIKLCEAVQDFAKCLKGARDGVVNLDFRDVHQALKEECGIDVGKGDPFTPYIISGQPVVIERMEQMAERVKNHKVNIYKETGDVIAVGGNEDGAVQQTLYPEIPGENAGGTGEGEGGGGRENQTPGKTGEGGFHIRHEHLPDLPATPATA